MIFHFLIDDPDVDHNCLHDVCWFSQHDTRTENKHTSDQSIKKWSLSRKSFCKICIFLSVGGIAKGVTGYFRGHGNLLALFSWQFFGKSFASKTNNYLCWDISAISARHVNNTVVPEEMAPLWRIILLLQYKSDKVFMIWFIVFICSQRCPRLLKWGQGAGFVSVTNLKMQINYFILFYFISFANRQGHRNSLRQLLRARNKESILRREETGVPGGNPRSQVEIDWNSIHIQHCSRGGRRDWCPLRQPDFPISHPEEHKVSKIIIVLRISSIIVHFNPNQIQLFNISAAITIPVKIW